MADLRWLRLVQNRVTAAGAGTLRDGFGDPVAVDLGWNPVPAGFAAEPDRPEQLFARLMGGAAGYFP
jgi:hypothetical protein